MIKQTSVWNRHFLQNFTNSLHSFWKISTTSWSCVHLFLKYHRTLGHSKQNAVSYRWSTPFFIFYTLILEDIVLSNKKKLGVYLRLTLIHIYIRIISLIYPNTAILVVEFYCYVVVTHPYIRPIAIFMLHRQLLH